MNNQEHEFNDIITSLEHLHSVKVDDDFRARIEKRLRPAKPYAMPLFALRVALMVFVVLLSGTSLVATAKESKPGDILYPVKQMSDSLKATFTTEQTISKAPVAPTQKPQHHIPTPTIFQPIPTVPSRTERQEIKGIHVTPTPVLALPTSTPAPTTAPQGILPATASQNAVSAVLDKLPDVVGLGGPPNPTPTPHSQHDGSKDNGNKAGAGGPLLPKINIKL